MTSALSSWPGERTAALVVNVMYEQWAPGVAPGLGPMGNPLAAGLLDHQAISWADYGWRTGVWELLALLDKESVPATFYVSGILAEHHPDSVRAIAEGGHEISGHAWVQNSLAPALTRDEERADIARCADALQSAGGQRPRGWISPRCTPSDRTGELLAEAGFEWFGDVFDADLPYWLETPGGRIAALPFGLEVNDLPMTVRYGQPTRELAASFEYAAHGLVVRRRLGYIDVTLHAHVGGRPPGLSALQQILETARGLDMWIATRGDIVDRFADAE